MEAVLPFEVEVPSQRIIAESGLEESEWAQARYDQLNLIEGKRLTAMSHGRLYQRRVKNTFDKKVRSCKFNEGDLVLKKMSHAVKDSRGKWAPNYEGPFIAKRAFSGGALILTNMDDEELPSPVNSDEMAPRKLASKRSRKDKAAEGTSSAPEYDSHRFRSAEHQQRFEAIKGWSFLRERRVQLRDDEYTNFQEEIVRRRWASLVTPMAKFDPDIVLEFYANAWPTEEGVRDMRSWVRGQWIPFDADAIGQLLGYPLSDGFDEEAIAHLLCIPGQDFARTAARRRLNDHNSDLPLLKCQLVYAILTRMSIHVAQLIADAIYIFAGMVPTRHPLDPDKSNRALGFPALITGLCQSFGVPVEPSKGDAPRAANAPLPHQAGPAGSFDTEQYLRHLVRQQAANHRAHVQTHDCLYQMSLSLQSQGFTSFPCPTPDQFRAEVAWPGDWPEARAGETPAKALDEADEAREDEEMADLLDFLGGSGAT
ncbi:hypothetical protein HKD37_15G043047 [Glycine soja]